MTFVTVGTSDGVLWSSCVGRLAKEFILGEALAGFGIIGIIITIVLLIVVIAMPFYVIAIHGHVKRIREIEDARFMMYLRHADITQAELVESLRTIHVVAYPRSSCVL
jgi:uncharacterized membrane protein